MIPVQRQIEEIIDQLKQDDGVVVGLRVDLFESGVLDSFRMLEYISELERVFGITISNDDLIPQNLWTIEATALLVERYLEAVNP